MTTENATPRRRRWLDRFRSGSPTTAGLLVATLVLSASACGTNSADQPSESAPSTQLDCGQQADNGGPTIVDTTYDSPSLPLGVPALGAPREIADRFLNRRGAAIDIDDLIQVDTGFVYVEEGRTVGYIQVGSSGIDYHAFCVGVADRFGRQP